MPKILFEEPEDFRNLLSLVYRKMHYRAFEFIGEFKDHALLLDAEHRREFVNRPGAVDGSPLHLSFCLRDTLVKLLRPYECLAPRNQTGMKGEALFIPGEWFLRFHLPDYSVNMLLLDRGKSFFPGFARRFAQYRSKCLFQERLEGVDVEWNSIHGNLIKNLVQTYLQSGRITNGLPMGCARLRRILLILRETLSDTILLTKALWQEILVWSDTPVRCVSVLPVNM